MKIYKFLLVHRACENTDVFITLDENIYGIHSKRVNILYKFTLKTDPSELLRSESVKKVHLIDHADSNYIVAGLFILPL